MRQDLRKSTRTTSRSCCFHGPSFVCSTIRPDPERDAKGTTSAATTAPACPTSNSNTPTMSAALPSQCYDSILVPPPCKNFSPSSQVVKHKLRKKLKAKMSKRQEPPPQPSLPPERARCADRQTATVTNTFTTCSAGSTTNTSPEGILRFITT